MGDKRRGNGKLHCIRDGKEGNRSNRREDEEKDRDILY